MSGGLGLHDDAQISETTHLLVHQGEEEHDGIPSDTEQVLKDITELHRKFGTNLPAGLEESTLLLRLHFKDLRDKDQVLKELRRKWGPQKLVPTKWPLERLRKKLEEEKEKEYLLEQIGGLHGKWGTVPGPIASLEDARRSWIELCEKRALLRKMARQETLKIGEGDHDSEWCKKTLAQLRTHWEKVRQRDIDAYSSKWFKNAEAELGMMREDEHERLWEECRVLSELRRVEKVEVEGEHNPLPLGDLRNNWQIALRVAKDGVRLLLIMVPLVGLIPVGVIIWKYWYRERHLAGSGVCSRFYEFNAVFLTIMLFVMWSGAFVHVAWNLIAGARTVVIDEHTVEYIEVTLLTSSCFLASVWFSRISVIHWIKVAAHVQWHKVRMQNKLRRKEKDLDSSTPCIGGRWQRLLDITYDPIERGEERPETYVDGDPVDWADSESLSSSQGIEAGGADGVNVSHMLRVVQKDLQQFEDYQCIFGVKITRRVITGCFASASITCLTAVTKVVIAVLSEVDFNDLNGALHDGFGFGGGVWRWLSPGSSGEVGW